MAGYQFRRSHGKRKPSRKKLQEDFRVPPKPRWYYSLRRPGRCRWCGDPTERPRQRWHPECVQEYREVHVVSETRRIIRKRDGCICAECGRKDHRWELDHKRPLWEQKDIPVEERDLAYWQKGNLQTLCRVCHREKSNREATERSRR